MLSAEFKGIRLPRSHTQIMSNMSKVEPVYRVVLREVGTGAKMIYAAHLIGGGEIAKGKLEQVKETVGGMFREKVRDWEES